MKNLRILLLNGSAIYGGGEYYVLQLARQLKNRGQFVVVGCRKDNLLFNKCLNDAIITEVIEFGEKGTKHLFRNIKVIKQIARENSIDIVHTNTVIDRTAGAIAARLAGAKHVTSCHSLISIRRNLTHYIRNNKYTDAFIADGISVKNLLVEKDKIKENKIYVINNGISPGELTGGENERKKIRRELNIADQDIVIGNTGRLVYFKGHKYLLNAFAELTSRYRNIRLLLIGDGELMETLKTQARNLGISNRAIFAGFRDDLQEVYSAIDIYVQPSVSGGDELFPYTVLYAMAHSVPVIATNVGDLPNMVENDKTGFVIEQKSSYRIAEKLEILINDASLRRSLGNESRRKMLSEFTIESMYTKTERVYLNILERNNMNYFRFLLFVFAMLIIASCNTWSQSEPVLYFCSKFDSKGESGIGSRFSTGPLVVVVRCDNELGIRKAIIQLDKFNGTEFVYYNAVSFNLKTKVQYTWFEDHALRADEPGFYRAYLLDENNKTLASALVEIVK